MACIYKIINDVNGHLYIGQTSTPIQERWRKHLDRFKHDSEAKGLYAAMRLYGIDNFHCEVIEQCEIEKLDERERFWISYYNTYLGEGYNLTPGGKEGSNLIDLPKDEIIRLYQTRLYSCEDLGKKYGVSGKTIHNRLIDWGVPKVITIKQEETRNINLEKGRHRKGNNESLIPYVNSLKKKVARLDKNGEIEKVYSSLSEACRDLGQATNHTNRITAAIEKDGICFGYHWTYVTV